MVHFENEASSLIRNHVCDLACCPHRSRCTAGQLKVRVCTPHSCTSADPPSRDEHPNTRSRSDGLSMLLAFGDAISRCSQASETASVARERSADNNRLVSSPQHPHCTRDAASLVSPSTCLLTALSVGTFLDDMRLGEMSSLLFIG